MVSLNRDALTEKVLAGDRISSDEALQLYRFPLEELGGLANARRDLAKSKSYGGRGRGVGTYIFVRNINYTKGWKYYLKIFPLYLNQKKEKNLCVFFCRIDPK